MHILDSTDAYVIEKQVDLLFNKAKTANLGSIACVLAVSPILSTTVIAPYSYALTLCVVILSIFRFFLASRFISNNISIKHNHKNINLHVNLYLLLTFFIGLAWGGFAFSQYFIDDNGIRNFIFLMNFCLMVASIVSLSSHLLIFIAFVFPQIIGIVLVFILENNAHGLYASMALIVFCLYFIFSVKNISNTKKQEIRLELENKQLIEHLNDEVKQKDFAQKQLEEHKNALELKIQERTKELLCINKDMEKEILEKKEVQKNLQYIAYHDQLTCLPNKSLLLDRIKHAITICDRDKLKLAVLFLDLDRFKTMNDSLGHSIGDLLLKEVSIRLKNTLRKKDTVARNGGDEFVVILERIDSIDAVVNVSEKIIEVLTATFKIQSHKIHIGASIGIGLFPDHAKEPLELLRIADTAMYRAKTLGGNRYKFYNEEMSDRLKDRLDLESHLYSALKNNEFYMVYQPQVDCNTGVTVGFEALLRWKCEDLGVIEPFRFVPLLEETGLIYSIGEWVINQVAKFIKSGAAGQVKIAINLSVLQCNDISLVDYIQRVVNDIGIEPGQLEFEVTESLLINDFEKTEEFFTKLHLLGCVIALDDFGTGYTSMSYLTRLPIDIIKIDRIFITDIEKNENLKSIVKAIVTMSESLKMENVFEGVETLQELETIKNLNGRVIQGYLLSKPLEADMVKSWLDKH